jgi:hypothetical protein
VSLTKLLQKRNYAEKTHHFLVSSRAFTDGVDELQNRRNNILLVKRQQADQSCVTQSAHNMVLKLITSKVMQDLKLFTDELMR